MARCSLFAPPHCTGQQPLDVAMSEILQGDLDHGIVPRPHAFERFSKCVGAFDFTVPKCANEKQVANIVILN